MTILEGNGAAPPPAGDLIKETTTQTFVRDVIEESKRQPVLIDFWAPWCGPCRVIAPVLDELARELGDQVTIGKVNVDEHPGLAGRFGVQAIPQLILFKDGAEKDRIVGAAPKREIVKRLDALRD